jgi:dipeptidyl aminopeptidase/acylaminoacyl peptidase
MAWFPWRVFHLTASVLVLICAGPVQSKRPLNIDDVLGMERFDSVALSPDRRQLVVTLLRPAGRGEVYGRTHYDLDPSRADLWLIDRTSGAVKRLTDGRARAAGHYCPVWSPDGQRIAFLSTRPEGREPRGGDNVRLYVWEKASGAIRRMSARAMAAQTRTGSKIAGIAMRGPGEIGTRVCRPNEDNAPFVWLDGQRLLAVTRPAGARSAPFEEYRRAMRHPGETLARLSAGDTPTASKLGSGAARTQVTGDDARNELRLLSLRGTDQKIAELPAYPFWGETRVAVAANGREAKVIVPAGLKPLRADEPARLPWENGVAERSGTVALAPGAVVRWDDATISSAGEPSAPGPARPDLPEHGDLLLADQDIAIWAEPRADGVTLIEQTPAGKRDLMTVNQRWREIDWGRRIFIDYPGTDGTTYKAVLLLPPGWKEDKPARTLFWIYPGYQVREGREYFTDPLMPGLYNLRLYAARGFAIAIPSIPLDRKKPPEDLPAHVTAHVLAAANALIARGVVDPARMAVFGQRFGGFGTSAVIAHTNRFKAAASLAAINDWRSYYLQIDPTARGYPGIEHERSANMPMVDNYGYGFTAPPWGDAARFSRNSPVDLADRINTPLLIVHGEQDVRGGLAQADALFMALWRQGKTARFLRYWGESHGLALSPANVRDIAGELADWFERWLPPDPKTEKAGQGEASGKAG